MGLQPELKRILLSGGAMLGLALALLGASMVGHTADAAPVYQESPTPSPTLTHTTGPSPTTSPTGSVSPSASVSPSGTVTATLQTNTPTVTATISPTATHSPTFPSAPTLPAFTAVPPPTLTPGLLVSPVLLATLPSATPAPPTATLKPFPQVTYQYPGRTPTYTLLARQAQSPVDDPPKGGGLSLRQIWRGLRSAAPWLILAGLWIGLALWFIVAQFLLRRMK